MLMELIVCDFVSTFRWSISNPHIKLEDIMFPSGHSKYTLQTRKSELVEYLIGSIYAGPYWPNYFVAGVIRAGVRGQN